jgi:hypothetical protein
MIEIQELQEGGTGAYVERIRNIKRKMIEQWGIVQSRNSLVPVKKIQGE